MKVFDWLDVSLLVLGLFALTPQLWNWFHRPKALRSPSRRRPFQLLFYLGFVCLILTAADVGSTIRERDYILGSAESEETRAGLFPLGMEAPDFSLPSVDGGDAVHLSDFRGRKPVVLIFGSFS